MPTATQTQPLIYIIDDDVSFQLSLKNALQLAGFHVSLFAGVADFLKISMVENAIILCDMQMPNETGLDLQEALKKRKLGLPIIFISGESSVIQAVTALKEGAIDFLIKPFEPQDLFKAIRKANQWLEVTNSHQKNLHKLTLREKQAFNYFLQGYQNKYVSEKMGIKSDTVKEYKSNIFKKLEVKNVSDLIEKYKPISIASY